MDNKYKTMTGMQSDTYFTGKYYPKLSAYMVSQRKESKGMWLYIYSSNQYRTQKRFKQSIMERHSFGDHVKLKIKKG